MSIDWQSEKRLFRKADWINGCGIYIYILRERERDELFIFTIQIRINFSHGLIIYELLHTQFFLKSSISKGSHTNFSSDKTILHSSAKKWWFFLKCSNGELINDE